MVIYLYTMSLSTLPFNLLVVCGPTASGKTPLAVALARELGGEIISADSRQVYRGLDLGSGKDLHEYTVGDSRVSYHMIDIADLGEIYTLYHYQRDFSRAFRKVTGRSRLPVLCGGTGLYIEAVLRGYAVPPVPENRPLRLQLMKRRRDDLEAMLRDLDGELHRRTDLSSKKRIVRSLEVAMHRQHASAPENHGPPLPAITPLILCTRWERPALHERIDRRLDERLSQGMVDEVRRLREEGLPDERLLMLGMEYKYITRHLRGQIDHAAMVAQLRRAIHQLAKRQETYFRGMERRGCSIHWIDRAELSRALAVVRRSPSGGSALPADR
ncbi:MAG: tRNA (adenosine(37)-N6)-dimethylallyltransferase MiaA [Chitinispirillaceae bacterium]|nr:tRNA (adenosine(37)-N6)-dimethylallyltransferase MiaA [Chitinispirillaceae bacterium]